MSNGPDSVQNPGAVAPGFEAFLTEQRGPLLAFLRRRFPVEADAQDAVQDCFTRLLRYAPEQPPSAWKPLLYRIATNLAHDEARLRLTHHTADHVPLEDIELVSDELPHDQQIAQEQELAILQSVIINLPPKCRQVYLLHRMEGMSYNAIAEHCGLSKKTVEMHISKALAALREAGKAYRDTF